MKTKKIDRRKAAGVRDNLISNRFQREGQAKSWHICITCHRAYPGVEELRDHRKQEHASNSDSALILDKNDLNPVIKVKHYRPVTLDEQVSKSSAGNYAKHNKNKINNGHAPVVARAAAATNRGSEENSEIAKQNECSEFNDNPHQTGHKTKRGRGRPKKSQEVHTKQVHHIQELEVEAAPNRKRLTKHRPIIINGVQIKVEGYTLPVVERGAGLDDSFVESDQPELQLAQPLILEALEDDNIPNQSEDAENFIMAVLDQNTEELAYEINQVLQTLSMTAKALFNEDRDLRDADQEAPSQNAPAHEAVQSHSTTAPATAKTKIRRRRKRDVELSDVDYEPYPKSKLRSKTVIRSGKELRVRSHQSQSALALRNSRRSKALRTDRTPAV